MAYKPILFNTEMVQAIQTGRKTQTRRIIKPQPVWDGVSCHYISDYGCWTDGGAIHIPTKHTRKEWPIKPGDILWVRETWRPIEASSAGWCRIEYKAGGAEVFQKIIAVPKHLEPWHPSIHMPKDAARIFLRVKDVRVERLKDIYEKYEPEPGHPVSLEGFHYTCDFIATWENTIKPADRERYGWEANPWVWVIEFECCEKPERWPDV